VNYDVAFGSGDDAKLAVGIVQSLLNTVNSILKP
jgi:hypothetical protein